MYCKNGSISLIRQVIMEGMKLYVRTLLSFLFSPCFLPLLTPLSPFYPQLLPKIGKFLLILSWFLNKRLGSWFSVPKTKFGRRLTAPIYLPSQHNRHGQTKKNAQSLEQLRINSRLGAMIVIEPPHKLLAMGEPNCMCP